MNKDVLGIFESYKDKVEFTRDDVPKEHDEKIHEFFDFLAENGYSAAFVIGTKEDQMVGMCGNKSSLMWLFTKAFLSDKDLLKVVDRGITALRGLVLFSETANMEDKEDGETDKDKN